MFSYLRKHSKLLVKVIIGFMIFTFLISLVPQFLLLFS